MKLLPKFDSPQTQALFNLLKAYHDTRYLVFAEPSVVLRIGQRAPWSKRHPAARLDWCLITADNPGSRQCNAETNAAAHQALAHQIRQDSLLHWPSAAQAEDGLWPDEQGYLVCFSNPQSALTWAHQACKRWHQLGVLLGGPQQAVRLYLWQQHEHFRPFCQGSDGTIAGTLREKLAAMNIGLL